MAIGLALWDRVTLPYDNPLGIVGAPALARYHPANNIVRFLILIVCPALALAAACAASKKMRALLLAGETETASAAPLTVRGRLLPAGLAILAALNLPTFHAWGPLHRFHEGESLGTAVSHLAGQAPYEDYLFAHGVYQDPLRSALAFRLFGRSIGAARVPESAAKIAVFALLALFLVEWLGPGAMAYGALLSVVTLHGLVALEAAWLPLAPLRIMPRDVTAMAFLLAMARLFRALQNGRGTAAPAFLTAFVAVGSFGYSIDRGFFLTATAAIAWTMLALGWRGRGAGRMWLWVAAGAATGAALVGFLLQWRLRAFFTFAWLVMPRYKEWMDGLIYRIEAPPMGGIAALVAANLFYLSLRLLGEHRAAGGRRAGLARFVQKHFLEACLLVLSLFFFRSALGRADLFHVTLSSWPAYLLAFGWMGRWWLERPHPLFGKAVRAAALVLALACAARIYTANLLAENFPARKPDSHYVEASYQEAARFLRENLGPQDSFFTLTSEAIWYYLIDKPCPARFPVVWFAAPPFYQQEIVESLRTKPVKLILYRNAAPSNELDGISNEQRLPILMQYVRENYRFFRDVQGHEIWIRR